MKGKRIFGWMLVLLALMLVVPASAQEETFGLSADDFALLASANAQSGAQTELTFDMAINFDINVEGDQANISLNGAGVINSDAEQIQISVDGAATNVDGDQVPLVFEGRLVDGMFYFNAVDPERGEPSGWVGDSLENLNTLLNSTAQSGALPVDPTDLESLMSDPAVAEQVGAIFQALENFDPSTFIAMERLDDSDGLAHFAVNLSISDLLSTEAVGAIVTAAASIGMDGSAQVPPEQLSMILPMIAQGFENSVVSVEQYIDSETTLVERTVLTIDIALDPAMFGATGEPAAFNLVVDLDFAYGDAPAVEAPADANMGGLASILPANMLPNTSPAVVPTVAALPTLPVEEPAAAAGVLVANEPVEVEFDNAPLTFTYEAASDEVINIVVSSVDGTLDTTVALRDSSDAQVAYNDDHGSDRELNRFDSVISEQAITAGTYTVVVSTFSGSGSGTVQVTVESESAAEPTPAPTPTEAPVIQPPAPNTGSTGTLTPNQPFTVDFKDAPVNLTYEAAADEVISIVVSSVDGSLDTTVALLDSDGSQLAFNDDHGSDRELNRFDSVISEQEIEAGTYTIVVNTFSGSGSGDIVVTVESAAAVAPTEAPNKGGVSESEVIEGEFANGENFEYTLSGTEGEVVTITARATDNSLDTVLALLGPDGDILAENDDHGTDSSGLSRYDSRIGDFELPETGDYTITVRGFAGSGGSFELSIERGGGGTPEQPNQGGSIDTINDSLRPGDTFTYTIEAEAGDVYTITGRGLDEEMDPVLALYDENGDFLASNDDHGSGDPDLSFFDARIERFIFQEDGSYTVELSGYRDASGDFEFTVERVASGAPLGGGDDEVFTDEIEPNGSFTQEFELQAGQYVTVTVRALTDEFDASVTLISPDGEVLASNDDHGSSDPNLSFLDARITNFIVEESGTYTAEVTGYGDSAGSFALIVNVK